MSGSERAHSTAHMYSCVQFGCHEVNLHDPHTEQRVRHLSLPDQTANKSCIFIRWRTALPLPMCVCVHSRMCLCARAHVSPCVREHESPAAMFLCKIKWSQISGALQSNFIPRMWVNEGKGKGEGRGCRGCGGGSHSTGVVLMHICREGTIKTIRCGKSEFSLLISVPPPSARCRIRCQSNCTQGVNRRHGLQPKSFIRLEYPTLKGRKNSQTKHYN